MKVSFTQRPLRKGFTLIELLVVIAIIALLAGVAYGPILDQINKGEQLQASENMKNVATAMSEFKQNTSYNSFPDDNTADRVLKHRPDMTTYGNLTGDTSNDYFRQLFVNENIQESNFYAKVQSESGTTAKPDDVIDDGKALEPGEVGISYVMSRSTGSKDANKKNGISSNGGELPLLMTSVLPDEDGSTVVPANRVRFDSDSFRGKVLIFTTTNRARTEDLDSNYNLPTPLIPTKRGKDVSDRFIVVTPDFGNR